MGRLLGRERNLKVYEKANEKGEKKKMDV